MTEILIKIVTDEAGNKMIDFYQDGELLSKIRHMASDNDAFIGIIDGNSSFRVVKV